MTRRNSTVKESKSRLNVFVALLRGVNVGGKNMLKMSLLKESFETIGFADVTTYINSGNVIFKTKESDARKLEGKVEQLLLRDYQLDSKVVVRSLSEMANLVKSLPRNWDGDSDWSYNVIFLRHTIDSEEILNDLQAKPDIEEVLYRPGTLLWSVQAGQGNRSHMQKLPARKIFKDMTVRNLNTTRKLHELMKKAAETDS